MAARGEVTGRAPHDSADSIERPEGPPCDDPQDVEPTPRSELRTASRSRAALIRGPPIERAAFTIAEFCAAHRISVETYYRLKREGLTPSEMKVRGRVLISLEAAARWRAEREAATKAESGAPHQAASTAA